MLLEEIKKIDTRPKKIREASVTVSIVLVLIGGFIAWRHGHVVWNLFWIAGILTVTGLLVPVVVRPLYRLWMILALLIGWVVSRVILTLLFYMTIVPIGLLTRVIGKDFLDLKFKENKESYWISRKTGCASKSDLEKQF